jgi:PIN domain nuclease of toxin-antitoxin system
MGGSSVNVLLDTHILVWWLAGEGSLSKKQTEVLERIDSKGERYALSAISLWEIAKLVKRGRIFLQRSIDGFFEDLENHSSIEIIPLTPRIALESTRLGDSFPKDPADQIIAATARVYGLSLVTADTRIRNSGVISVI